ncbi:MAG: hypothetical protein ACRCT6_06015, partial [Notoacmeibacter sp.]
EIFAKWQTWIGRLAAFGLVVVTIALAGLAVGLIPYLENKISWAGIFAAGFALFAGWLALGFGSALVGLPRLATISLSAAVFYGLTFAGVLPSANSLWISRSTNDLLQTVENCSDPDLASVSFYEPSLVFLAGTKTNLTGLEGAAAQLKSENPCSFALVPQENMTELQTLVGNDQKLETIGLVSGINYSKGAKINLALVRLLR